jgi:hypothetical protein
MPVFHSLSSRGAVHVRRVTCQKQPTFAVMSGHAMVKVESRRPYDLLDPCRRRQGPSCVEHGLHVVSRRMRRRFVHRRHDAVSTVRHGRHHRESFRREEEHHFVRIQRPIHPHVGQIKE